MAYHQACTSTLLSETLVDNRLTSYRVTLVCVEYPRVRNIHVALTKHRGILRTVTSAQCSHQAYQLSTKFQTAFNEGRKNKLGEKCIACYRHVSTRP